MKAFLAIAVAALASAAPAAARDPQLLNTEKLSPRLQELTFRTPELSTPTKVRVLLPAGYASERKRDYPVLYLLHGAGDDYRAWTRPEAGKGQAEQLTAGLPLIVVMPDGGRGGFYTDWFNNGKGGRPRWETWHIRRLIPFIDHRYRTEAKRSGRAIAGLSMGGFGTFSYASRHPDQFTAAVSFSGAVDTTTPQDIGPAIIDSISANDGGPPGSLWGPWPAQELRWRAHNPFDLAENLRGLALTLRTGTGEPGGPFGGTSSVDIVEAAVAAQGLRVHERLLDLHIPHVWDNYGPGQHLWPYWNRGLRQSLPALMTRFRNAPKPPARITFTAAEPAYAVYGWAVKIKRPGLEFTRLSDAGRRGFALSGSGGATVTTPAFYTRGRTYAVTVRGSTHRLKANRRGRLRFALPLGPGKTRVTIAAAG